MSNNIDQELIDELTSQIADNKDIYLEDCNALLESHKGLIEDYAVLLKQNAAMKTALKQLSEVRLGLVVAKNGIAYSNTLNKLLEILDEFDNDN